MCTIGATCYCLLPYPYNTIYLRNARDLINVNFHFIHFHTRDYLAAKAQQVFKNLSRNLAS